MLLGLILAAAFLVAWVASGLWLFDKHIFGFHNSTAKRRIIAALFWLWIILSVAWAIFGIPA